MVSPQLSPWTMAWFGAALLCLPGSLALALVAGVGPGDWLRGSGLAVVHLFMLGWLGLALLGALIQFVPVLTARPAAGAWLALPALLATLAGLGALVGGFLWLDGYAAALGAFLVAPWLLALGFGLVLAIIGPPLCARASLRLAEVRMVLLALLGLVGLWGSGVVMVLELTGRAMVGFLPAGLSLHILFGVGGWMSLVAFGVSYKLFAMFLLAPERGGGLRRAVLVLAGMAQASVVGAALSGVILPPVALAVLLALTAGLYLAEIARIWRARRRPRPDANMLWSRVALAFLALSALLVFPAFLRGGVWAEAAVFAALAGWLSLLTLAQMVKIVGFLTWMQVFAPRIGRGPVPVVQDLTNPRAMGRWLALWSAGAAGGTLALVLVPMAFPVALAVLLLAALGVVHEVLAIRRLSHLAPGLRPAAVPPLIFPAFNTGSAHDHTA